MTVTRLPPDQIAHGSLSGLSNDDHTQYALLAGRSGGQTLRGGTAASNNLTLSSTSSSTKGRVVLSDEVTTIDSNRTYTSAPVFFELGGGSSRTITLDYANVTFNVLRFTPTVVLEQSAFAFNLGSLFAATPTIKNANGETNTFGPFFTLLAGTTWQADGATLNNSARPQDYRSAPGFSTINSGSLSFTNGYSHIESAMTIGAGCTIATRYGYLFTEATGAGTLTTQVVIDIENLTKASTNLSLRSAGTNVEMRHAGPAVFGENAAARVSTENLRVYQPTNGNVCTLLSSAPGATTDRLQLFLLQDDATTTNATTANVVTITPGANMVVVLDVLAVARQTGGTAGTVGHGAGYRLVATYRTDGSGNATQIGTDTMLAAQEDNAAWNLSTLAFGTAVLVRVTGEANKTIDWHLHVAYSLVST